MKGCIHTKIYYMDAHSSVLRNSLQMETIQMFISRWNDEKIVVYHYDGMVAIERSEPLIHPTMWMNLKINILMKEKAAENGTQSLIPFI